MVNKGLNQEDVFLAAQEIEKSGEEPSAKKIRDHIGSGSLTTISKYFKQWQVQKTQIKIEDDLDLKMILKDFDTEVVAEFFSNEHPQIIALVFSYLDPLQVAKILTSMPDILKDDVLDRMEKLGFVKKQFVQNISQVIKEELRALSDYHGEQKGGPKFVQKIREEMKR